MGWLWYCRDAGARDRTGASGRTGDGGPLHLYAVAWGADPGGLGRVRTDPALALSWLALSVAGSAVIVLCLGVDAATARVLEGRRNPFSACARSHGEQSPRAQQPRRRPRQERPNRRGDKPIIRKPSA